MNGKNNRSIKLLVAEDSLTQAEQIRCTLEDHGYTILLARDGRQAYEMTVEQRPTLIISDIMMPEMDGYELCTKIKQNPELQNIPIVLLTSLSDPVDVVRGLECGADNFLVKPYDERYLISRINYMLSNRQLRESDFTQMGVEILFAGTKYFITSDRMQILNLLLSTYETAVQKNRELLQAQNELKALAESLDDKVRERTAQLQAEIDERRRAEAELQRMIERERKLSEQLQQAQKMEAIGRLAGGVAHDFNNLLTVINGCSDLLMSDTAMDEDAHDLLNDISKSGKRAAALTSQLLAFSHKTIIESVPLNLNDVVHDLQKMLNRLVSEDIEIATKLDPELNLIKSDHSQIEQVIMNLVVNASDAMPKGGRILIETHNIDLDEPYVDTHIEVEPDSYVQLVISDNGIGMSEDIKVHIFEPFFTTKGPGKGTGLGLATIYGIIKQNHGHIFVYSELGTGTTFKIYLPVTTDREATPRPTGRSSDDEILTGNETILLVEDEEGVRKLSRIVLESAGYKVLVASNGKEALEIAQTHPETIDLLLSDVVMPEMSGQQMVRVLEKTQPHLKVIFMSGYTDDAIVRYGVLHSHTPFLQKPFTPSTLTRKVREILDSPEMG